MLEAPRNYWMLLAGLHCPCSSLRSHGAACRTIRSKLKATLQPPPADYAENGFRADCQESTEAFIRQHHPQLVDLVDDGSLVVLQRPELYVERRTDGYKEPEVVYILGTAHLSDQSAANARRLIQAVRPQNVVVELCRSRAGIMYDPPSASKGEFSASGGGFVEVTQRMLQLGGGPALLLRLLLQRATRGLGQQMGVAPGQEFRAAREAAEECSAQLVLGDRPIEVSLQRAWDALCWRQRLQLLAGLAQAAVQQPAVDASLTTSVVENMKSDTAISAMLSEFSARFPEVKAALVDERDIYLTWSLTRSKAVNGCHSVVGIVGRGHLPGIMHAATHYHGDLRFRDLAGSRRGKGDLKGRIVRRLAFELALLVATVVLWHWITEGRVCLDMFNKCAA